MIPKEYIKELLESSSIAKVIGREIELTKVGRNYVGTCPFHKSGVTSKSTFTVSPEKNFYHCFGCHAHGSAIDFNMKFKGFSFPESVAALAEETGFEPPPDSSGRLQKKRQDIQGAANIFAEAIKFYEASLRQSVAAVDYLKAKGISGKTAKFYKIGFSPDDWSNLKTVFHDRYDSECVEYGLVKSVKKGGKNFDRYRGRIMFPMFDAKGMPLGFTGLSLKNEEPEYLFAAKHGASKTVTEIFGLLSAQKHIHQQEYVLVAQNCLDVLALHENEIYNCVSLATYRVKTEHIQLLFRRTSTIVFIVTNDDAGAVSAWIAMEAALPAIIEGKNVRFAILPEDYNVSSLLIQEDGIEDMRQAVTTAISLSEFLFQTLTERFDIHTIEDRAALISETEALLEAVASPRIKNLLQQRLESLFQDNLQLLNSIEEHDQWLSNAIKRAKRELIIVSPWITSRGIERFDLCEQIKQATLRGVSVEIYTDKDFNRARKNSSRNGDLFDDGSFRRLTAAGSRIEFVQNLHSKVVVIDADELCIGSFNWLSASADKYRRHEVSVVHRQGSIVQRKDELLTQLNARQTSYDDHLKL